MTRHQIIITNHQFEVITTIKENFPVDSVFWSDEDLLIYTTSNHWKYALMNGETGLLKTLEKSIHLLKKISDNKLLAFDSEDKIIEI